MRDEPGAIHFENQDIVDHPYLAALHKLHPPLVAQGINRQADAVAIIHMSALGEKLDVERHSLHVPCCLGMHVACCPESRAWVIPLPLLSVSTQLCVGLGWPDFHIYCYSIILYYMTGTPCAGTCRALPTPAWDACRAPPSCDGARLGT